MGLAFAAAADRPTALLNGAVATTGPARADPAAAARAIHDMVRAGLDSHAFSARRPWCGAATCSRPLEQILFQTADAITPSSQQSAYWP
jgi:hypothetical protein